MTSKPEIRTATIEDAPLMAKLEARIFPEDPWPAADIQGMMSVPYVYGHIVSVEGEDVGYSLIQGAPKAVADILTIGVVPEGRKKGAAKALLEAMFDVARELEVSSVYLEVRQSNTNARAFYQKAGGVEAGKRPGYYRAQGAIPAEDAIVYQFVL